MKCIHCQSEDTTKNGTRNGKQNYICKQCGKQFLEAYSPRGYPEKVKKICINLRKNGMKYREIERMTGVSHNTVILWVKQNQKSEISLVDFNEAKDST